MEKIAIFNYSGIRENVGGPTGYLNNLCKGLREIGTEIKVFSVCQIASNRSSFRVKTARLGILQELRAILYLRKKGMKCKTGVNEEIHNYPVVHAHSSEDVYFLRKYVRYTGKIVFTPHRPEPLAQEKITLLKNKSAGEWNFPLFKRKMKEIEVYSYRQSSAFIFPSKGAMSIYRSFPGFSEYSAGKPVSFVMTGVCRRTPSITKEAFRNKLGIGKDDFVICFIGRHNKVKGFDLLIEVSDKLDESGIKVICAGGNESSSSFGSNNWIEMGYISDPENLMFASDLVVVPNLNTYFDLVIIEALSLGKIVVTSSTGGNIDIASHTKGVRLFEKGSKIDLLRSIFEVATMNMLERESLQRENIAFYNKHCTVKAFAENYLKGIRSICSRY